MATVTKALKQEKELAEALLTIAVDEEWTYVWDRVFSGSEGDALVLARAIFHELGLLTAYDAVVESVIENTRIEKMMAAQAPDAHETMIKLRKEFTALPTDGLKALRMLIDAAIKEKEDIHQLSLPLKPFAQRVPNHVSEPL